MFRITIKTPVFAIIRGDRLKIGGREMTVARNEPNELGGHVITLTHIDNDATLHTVTMIVGPELAFNVY